MRKSEVPPMEIAYVEWRYERAINAFGYSFRDLA
jgi:hypothetical protein